MNLPSAFEEKMKYLLGTEYDDYLNCFDEPRHYGLRINTAKISVSLHGLWKKYRGYITDFIMTARTVSRRNIPITMPVFITCRSRVP